MDSVLPCPVCSGPVSGPDELSGICWDKPFSKLLRALVYIVVSMFCFPRGSDSGSAVIGPCSFLPAGTSCLPLTSESSALMAVSQSKSFPSCSHCFPIVLFKVPFALPTLP